MARNLCTPRISLCVAGNIVLGGGELADIVIKSPKFFSSVAWHIEMVNQPNVTLRLEAVKTLSNVASGDPTQIQALLKAQSRFNIMESLASCMVAETDEIKTECMWAYWNIFLGGTEQQMYEAGRLGGVESLLVYITMMCQDEELLLHAIDTLNGLLYSGRSTSEFAQTGRNPLCSFKDIVAEACLKMFPGSLLPQYPLALRRIRRVISSHFPHVDLNCEGSSVSSTASVDIDHEVDDSEPVE